MLNMENAWQTVTTLQNPVFAMFSRALGNVVADWSETKTCETGLLLFTR